MSNILDCMPLGEEVEIRGPTGEITYTGNGTSAISGEEMKFSKINLALGNRGLTPGYALIARALLVTGEEVQVCVVEGNKSEADILLREELEHFVQESKGRLKVAHVLSHPSEKWQGLKGYVNSEILRSDQVPPGEGRVFFVDLPQCSVGGSPGAENLGLQRG
ncbi:hypothetical protein LTR17_000138 [Elasticomyces elasticus]|nr:hypothetical protein LTR17_000138 [Elasticomyces elasticus]